MQAFGRLRLVGGVLGREAEDVADVRGLEIREVIAEGARLRRAAARAGNVVPAGGSAAPGCPVRG